MASDDRVNVAPGRRGVWLSRVFWITACVDAVLFLASLWNVWTYPRGQFDGLVVFGLLVVLGLTGATMAIVALIRRPAAYAIALVLVAAPLLLLGIQLFSVTG